MFAGALAAPAAAKFLGWGALGSGLAGLFGGGGEDPSKEANKYYSQIPGKLKPYFDPYINAGHSALGQLQGQYGNLINDPNSIYNKLAGGYKESPGYQFQLGQGMNAVNNAAAAGGLLGSPQHQQHAATLTQGLANQDFNNYLSQVMGLYGQGLSGQQGLAGMGLQAGTSMADQIAQALAQQGALAYQGAANQNQSRGSMFGNLLGGAGLLGAFG